MKLKEKFTVVNEGPYKVLYLFGLKIRFRSRIRALRLRITELEDQQHRQGKKLQQQQQEYSRATQRLEAMLVAQEKHILELRQQLCTGLAQAEDKAEQLSAGIVQHKVDTETRLQELSTLSKADNQELAAACTQNREATEAVTQRVEALEKQELAAACAYNQEATEAVVQRVHKLESEVQDKSREGLNSISSLREQLHAIDNRYIEDKKGNEQAIKKLTDQCSIYSRKLATYDNPRIAKRIQSMGLPSANRDFVNSQIELLQERGVSDEERKPQLIVSLTSYPKRMYDLHLCLYSLLTQDLKPDKIILWLAKEQFPRKSNDVPKKVKELKKWGLEIKWCSDLKSYKKLIPSLQQYPDACIVTADDDIYYPSNWLRGLWETYKQTGARMVAHRCHKAAFENGAFLPYSKWQKCIQEVPPSYTNFMTGAGGILYAPGCFHEDVLNVDKFQALCPHGDDIWFWAMALLNGTRIAIPESPFRSLVYTNPEREVNANDDGTLYASNGTGGNDVQLANVLAAYPDLGKIFG